MRRSAIVWPEVVSLPVLMGFVGCNFRNQFTPPNAVAPATGYFDLRDQDDVWIRVWVKKGGMIVFPAGIYHRFTLDSDNYIKVP